MTPDYTIGGEALALPIKLKDTSSIMLKDWEEEKVAVLLS